MTEENLRLNHDTTLSRDDLTTIVSMIPDGSRILDLGCGSGRLLRLLAELKHGKVMGVECAQSKVIECTGRGVPVIQADLDEGLPDFADQSYDFVILSRTLQAVKRRQNGHHQLHQFRTLLGASSAPVRRHAGDEDSAVELV